MIAELHLTVKMKITMKVRAIMESLFYITNVVKMYFFLKIAKNTKVYAEMAITHLTPHRLAAIMSFFFLFIELQNLMEILLLPRIL